MEIIIIIGLIVFFFHDSIFDFIEWILDVFFDILDFFAGVKEALEKFWNWLLDLYDKISNRNVKSKEKVYFEPVKEKPKEKINTDIPHVIETPNKEPIKEVKTPVANKPVTQIKQDDTAKYIKEEKSLSYHLTITNRGAFITKNKDQFDVLKLINIFRSYSLKKVIAKTSQGKNYSLRGEIPALEFVNTVDNDFDIIIEGKHCFIAMKSFIEALYANGCIDVNTYKEIMKRFKTITVTYQYNDKGRYVFVDETNKDEYHLNEDQIHLHVYSLKENEKYDLLFVDEEVDILTFYTEKKQISCHLTIINREHFLTKTRARSDVLRLTNQFNRYTLTKAVARLSNGHLIHLNNETSASEFVTTKENDFDIIIEGKHCYVAMKAFISALYNNKCIDISQYNNVVNRFKLHTVIYQYNDNNQYIFMDETVYDTYRLTEDQIFMNRDALKENNKYDLLFVDGKPETLVWYNEDNHKTKETDLTYQLTIKNIDRLISNSVRGVHADLLPIRLSKYKLNRAFVKTKNGDEYSLGREMQIFEFKIHGEDEYTLHIEGKDQALAIKDVLDLFYHLDMIASNQYDRIMKHFMIKTVTYHPSLSNQKYMFSDENNYYPLTADQIYFDVDTLNENKTYNLLFVDNNPAMIDIHKENKQDNIMSEEETIVYNNIRSKEAHEEEIEETFGPILFKDHTLFNKHIDAIANSISKLYEYNIELFHNERLYDMKSAESLKEADIQKSDMCFIAVRGKKNTFDILTFVCDLLDKADIGEYAAFRFERKRTRGTLPVTDCLTFTKLNEAKYIVYKEQPYEIKNARYSAYLKKEVPDALIIVYARKLNKTSFESLELPLDLNDVMIVTDLSEEEMMEKYPCINEEPVKEEVKEYPSDVRLIIDNSCLGCYECVEACPEGAIEIDLFASCIQHKCTGCGKCIDICPIYAISLNKNYKG